MTIHDSGLRIEGFDELTPIGRGGSSDVYRGVDDPLGRTVAVKVLRFDGRSADPTRLFLRECQATERLSNHPHIATVFRSGVTADGRPYVVVEDATNGSLGDELVDGPLSLERVAEVGRAIAAALAYAHAHGVQHRDVKPSNVLVAADGTPLLADFGLAAVAGSTATTVSGHPYTLAYAPPEVLRGRPTDERSDVYSLGATLYELIEGRPPFAELGLTMPEVLARTLNSNVPPITRDDVPRSVRELVMSMLSADPSARPDLEAVIAVLDDPHADRPSRTGRRHRPRPGLVVGGAVLVVAVVCAGVWWSVRDDATADIAAGAARLPRRRGPSGFDAVSRRHRRVRRAGGIVVWHRRRHRGDRRPASDPAADRGVPAGTDLPGDPVPPRLDAMAVLTSERCRAVVLGVLPVRDEHDGVRGHGAPRGPASPSSSPTTPWRTPNEAAQFFRGRSISLGVTAATCHVDGDDVHIDQRTAPLSARPAWADQVSSWTVTPDQRGPGEQEAVVYVFRVGRTLWEARIGTGSGTSLTNTELRHLLDAIGTAAAG